MAIAIDGTSPAYARADGTSVTTASFTPPAGSIIIAIAAVTTSSDVPAISDSRSLTWNAIASGSTRDSINARWALSATSAAMTVTATVGTSAGVGLYVFVLTGVDTSDPIGGATAATAAATDLQTSITVEVIGSLLIYGLSTASGTTVTAESPLSDYATNPLYTSSTGRFYIATGTSTATGSTTTGATNSASRASEFVLFEVLEAAAGKCRFLDGIRQLVGDANEYLHWLLVYRPEPGTPVWPEEAPDSPTARPPRRARPAGQSLRTRPGRARDPPSDGPRGHDPGPLSGV